MIKEYYFYRVSWGWYEEYEPKVFYSKQKLTQEEFNSLIKDLAKQAVEQLVEKHDGWIGNSDIIKKVWKLLQKRDFKELEHNATYYMWGSSIIEEKDAEYTKHFDEETLRKIYKHNAKIENGLGKHVGF